MKLEDLTADDIIKAIKKKKAPYHSKGYLYFDNTKLSPVKIFDTFGITEPFHTINQHNDINRNIYTKLLSILPELNREKIYLKIPNSYTMDEKYKELYQSQLKYLPESKQQKNIDKKNKTHPLNQILYGPPGTGKTYNTINRALEIIDGVVPEDREEAREKFNKYRESGQIEFVTFHQSYGYEEFVEGIKADIKSGEIKYILEDGIFKTLVDKALLLKDKQIDKNGKRYYLNAPELGIKAEMIQDSDNEFRVLKGSQIRKEKTSTFNSKNLFEEFLKKGKYQVKDNYYILIDDFTFSSKSGSASVILGSPQNGNVAWKSLEEVDLEDNTNKNYILIIDEINRGNISKIFGELITLIEPSKRLGADEALKLTLPNSKDSFGVPSNLYIIGTMNTADRSIAQIDTALRRRFEFVEMMPDHSLLKDVTVVHDDKTIEIEKVLEGINERIEYIYDREHTIGHSYFIPLIKEPTKEKLDEIFKVNILPLLAEYFYGDWKDIRFVLNNDFVTEKKPSRYINSSTRQLNKVYEINDTFKPSEYLKIYATDNN